jgi:O-antigen/teichoic acid export membrane protein
VRATRDRDGREVGGAADVSTLRSELAPIRSSEGEKRPEPASAAARPDAGGQAGLTETVVRGAGVTAAGYLLTQVLTLVSYIAFARLAAPEVFGTLAAGWTIIGVSAFLAESGMNAALIQRKDRLEEAASTATAATFAAGIALSLLALALSPVVGLYFQSHEVGLVAAALSGVLFINAAMVVPDALLRRRFSFLRTAVVNPIDALCYGAIGAGLLAAGMGVWGLVIATYGAGVVRVGSAWLFAGWVPRLHLVSLSMWRELARYGRHIVASEFLRQVSEISNALLLGRFLGLAPLGEFRFGWRLATQAAFPATSAGLYVLFPAFARIADDLDRFRAAFLRSLRLLGFIVLPIAVALVPLGQQLAVALLGPSWRAAGSVIAALAGAAAALPLITLANEVSKAANRPDLIPRLSLLLTVGTVVAIVAFLPLGLTGVAAGLSLAYVVAAAYALNNVTRVLALTRKAILAELWGPLVASALMAGGLAIFAESVVDIEGASTLSRLAWLLGEACLALLLYASAALALVPATALEFARTLRSLRPRSRQPA